MVFGIFVEKSGNSICEAIKSIKLSASAHVNLGVSVSAICIFNPILSGLWNYVTERGGAIMARMDSSHPEAVSRHPKAQKWLPSNFFDLWLSIDTKNSTLWAVVLANPAVKRPWWKMKIFMQKYVKIQNFLIHESYIHQKKA